MWEMIDDVREADRMRVHVYLIDNHQIHISYHGLWVEHRLETPAGKDSGGFIAEPIFFERFADVGQYVDMNMKYLEYLTKAQCCIYNCCVLEHRKRR